MSSYLSYGRPTALILLRPDHTIVLRIAYLGWEPLQTKTKKGRTKIVYKFKNKVSPTSFTNLFSYEIEKTNCHLRGISSGLCLLKPHTNNKKN